MVKPHVKVAELHEVIHVADNLRKADEFELYSARGVDVDLRVLLADSWRSSSLAWSIIHEGQSIGSFGVAPINKDWGSPWLLGTDTLPEIAKEFLKQCPHYIEQMHSVFPNLMNYVHVENHSSIRWLKWLGFNLLPSEPIGKSGAHFYPFVKTKRYS